MLCIRQAACWHLLGSDTLAAVETVHKEYGFPGLILISLTLEYIRSIANTITGIITQAWKKNGGEEYGVEGAGEGVFDTTQRHSVSSHAHPVQFHDSFSDSFLRNFVQSGFFFLFFFFLALFPTLTKTFPLLRMERTAHNLHTLCSMFRASSQLR